MKLASRLQSAADLVRRYSILLVVAAGVLVLAATFARREAKIKTDLRYALATASAQLSHLFAGLEATEEFDPREILELAQEEMTAAAQASPTFRARVYFQLFNPRHAVVFDSRAGKIARLERFDPVRLEVAAGDWRSGGPFRYVDWDLLGDGRWFLRVAVTQRDYFRAQALILGAVLLGFLAVTFAAHYAREADLHRRFDRLIGAMPQMLRQTRTEQTLVENVPSIIGRMLGFDAVGAYLCDGDRIVPKALYSKNPAAGEAFLRSTDAEPITIDQDYPESRAMRDNTALVVRGGDRVHRVHHEVAGAQPYILAPISSPGEQPLGLLCAQRRAGLVRSHLDFLRSCGEIVALLLENIRAQEALIRNAHTVTLGTVVPEIAHSMKNQLSIVNTLARSVERDFQILSRQEATKRLEELDAQTRSLYELLDSIEEYRRLGQSRSTSVKVTHGLRRVCELRKEYFRIKNIDLEQRYSIPADLVVDVGELEFAQVVNNLLTNADEAFTELLDEEGHFIPRRGMRIEVTADAGADGSVLITVADNGPGIAEDILPRIFDQDFTTRKSKNTGTGLPSCRHVVARAGGMIDARSVHGEGAVFTIALPARPWHGHGHGDESR